jgi:diguanylate cyclase (GGDEF)-like protein
MPPDYDELTGLLSRSAFETALERRNHDKDGAVLIADIDAFRFVNAVLGHSVGDVLLRGIGHLAKQSAPPSSVVARFGSNKFAIYITDDAEAPIASEQIRKHVQDAFNLERQDTRNGAASAGVIQPPESLLTLSIGWACLAREGRSGDTVKFALSACQVAKANGGNRVVAYDSFIEDEGDTYPFAQAKLEH